MTRITGMLLVLFATAGFVAGAVTQVPEVDPATGVGALALLSGALLVIRARRKM
jgi:hypothetical protein